MLSGAHKIVSDAAGLRYMFLPVMSVVGLATGNCKVGQCMAGNLGAT